MKDKRTKRSRRHNALKHGAYARDTILPGERPEDRDAIFMITRLDFRVPETTQDVAVDDIAKSRWRGCRISRLEELAFAALAREHEKFAKRSGDDSYPNAVVQLSEAFASIADGLKNNESLGKLGANMRWALSVLEKLQPIIAAGPKSSDEGIDRAFKRLQVAFELSARNDAQIFKRIQILAMIREYQRQYGQDSDVKLLPRDPRTADATATKEIVLGAKSSSKKTDANDNWDDNDNDNDNDDDNEIDPDDFDWAHEYDEALAEQKKARRRHRKQGKKGFGQ